MRHDEAVSLIRDGVDPGEGWADLGAGGGVFTRALGELIGGEGEVWAVDRDAEAVHALRGLEVPGRAALQVLRADFTTPLELPAVDGILMANALHFAADHAAVLRQVAGHLRPGGKLLLVEYDRRRGNRWVPHPIPSDGFLELVQAVGLLEPREIGRRRSGYQGEMYAAVARRPAGGEPS